MRRCDALVLPYRRGFEAQSGVLLQACRFGKPVVASDVSDLGRQVAEDGVGLVVPPEDAGALAAALGRIAERPDAFDAALSAARGRYSWERVAELHLAEYEKGSGPFFAAEKGPDPFSVPA
jgi:glycosyltransferase involved in cell wall biosynthesis